MRACPGSRELSLSVGDSLHVKDELKRAGVLLLVKLVQEVSQICTETILVLVPATCLTHVSPAPRGKTCCNLFSQSPP